MRHSFRGLFELCVNTKRAEPLDKPKLQIFQGLESTNKPQTATHRIQNYPKNLKSYTFQNSSTHLNFYPHNASERDCSQKTIHIIEKVLIHQEKDITTFIDRCNKNRRKRSHDSRQKTNLINITALTFSSTNHSFCFKFDTTFLILSVFSNICRNTDLKGF